MDSDHCCYIIYSPSLEKFYIGYTTSIEERIRLHNTGHFGRKSYTYKAKDWTLYFLIRCDCIEQAVFVESKIKKMKSRKYIENLKKYPDISKRLLNDYYRED